MKATYISKALPPLGLAILLVWAASGDAQQTAPTTKTEPKTPPRHPAPKKESALTLEQLLSKALKDNPDIRVAESKLREAEAELNRTRLQVTQKAVTLHQSLERQKGLIADLAANLQQAQKLFDQGRIPVTDFNRPRLELEAGKEQLARLESEMQYLLGASPNSTMFIELQQAESRFIPLVGPAVLEGEVLRLHKGKASWTTIAEPKHTAMADKIRAALDKLASAQFNGTNVHEALKELQKTYDIPFVSALPTPIQNRTLMLQLVQVPLGAVLQALEDFAPDLRFVVRDYGVLVTSADRLPPGATLLHDFWHMQPAMKPGAAKEKQ
jgi:hypothetical protein